MENISIHKAIPELTQRVVDELDLAIQSCPSKVCNVALSGGSTPKAIFEGIAQRYPKHLNWNRLAFYWVDERCVPHSSPESNYGEAYRLMLGKVNATAYPINGEASPEAEAKRYSELIYRNLLEVGGLPQFDLMLLGIGNDGHTASIFPNQMELLGIDSACAAAHHPDTGQSRITLTGKTILNATKLIFIATGTDKQPILKEVLGESGRYQSYPAWHIASGHSNCLWLLDEQASEYNLESPLGSV